MPWVYKESAAEFIERNGGKGTERRMVFKDENGNWLASDVVVILPTGARLNMDTGQREEDVDPLTKLDAQRRYLQSAKHALNGKFRALQGHITALCAQHAAEGHRSNPWFDEAFERGIDKESEKLKALASEGKKIDRALAEKDREIEEFETRTGRQTARTIQREMLQRKSAATATAQRALNSMAESLRS
jgi:hypothetical protein